MHIDKWTMHENAQPPSAPAELVAVDASQLTVGKLPVLVEGASCRGCRQSNVGHFVRPFLGSINENIFKSVGFDTRLDELSPLVDFVNVCHF